MTDVLIALAAGYLASVLVLWALWVSDRRAERREWDAETAEGLAAASQRYPSRSLSETTWHCPYCPDRVSAVSVDELHEAALVHLRLCSTYRVSGSWEAVS